MEFTGKEIENILTLTEDAYSRDRYGEKNWLRLTENLGQDGFKPEEAIWILNSKYTRWAADHFAKEDTKSDENETFDGTELRQYKKTTGIDIDKEDLPEIVEQLRTLNRPKIKTGI